MSSYEKSLIMADVQLLEVDDEEQKSVDDITIQSDLLDLINNFGKDQFKEIYLNLYNEIRLMDIEKKKNFCNKLNEKIYEVYNFEFTPKLELINETEIEEFFEFIEFLEFDHISFIAEIIKDLDLNLLKNDLILFLNNNLKEILHRIDIFVNKNEKKFKIISLFFRTNNRYNVIRFLKSKIEKRKMLIILKVMEGEVKNERQINN